MLRLLRRSRRGQSLVESALILPVLLTMTLGLIDVGFTFFAYIQVINSSREGARAASQYQYLHNSPSSIGSAYSSSQNDSNRGYGAGGVNPVYADNAQASARRAVGRLDPSRLTVTVSYPESLSGANPSRSGQPVKVSVTYPYTLPVVSTFGFGAPTITLRSSTTKMIRADLDRDR